jgi:putative ABC transport system permease protein
MSFLKQHELGFNDKNILVINLPQDTNFRQRSVEFIEEFSNKESISEAALTGSVPGYTVGKRMFYTADSNKLMTFNFFIVGHNYLKLLGIPLVEGQFFNDKPANDSIALYIINQVAADTIKAKNLIGSYLKSTFGKNGKIIGVVRNFHFSSLYNDVEPLVMALDKRARYALLKIKPAKQNEAIELLQSVWEKYNKNQYLHYVLLNDKLNSLYSGDYKLLSLFTYFSVFVVFISSLGLYGLSAFLIEQRTKEIGIRKVLGGSAKRILFLLIKDYLKLVLLAGIIASPIVYLFMGQWLDLFATSIDIGPWQFLTGIIVAMLIAFITVFVRVFKVINESPSLALGFE